MDQIDAVYLWVDGLDPAFQQEMARWRGFSSGQVDASARRFRSFEELRYSLRSLEMHAPWIHTIHLVTNGQVPAWLNLEHPRLKLATHAGIFADPGLLPCFNSNAIELRLHRLPGLSRRFLLFNDDLFLGKPCPKEMFLKPGGGTFCYFEPNPILPDFERGPIHDRAYLYTLKFLKRLGSKGRNRRQPAAYQRAPYASWRFGRYFRRLPAHMPQIYDRNILARLESELVEEFRNTAGHRFRSGADLVLRVAYFYALIEAGWAVEPLETRLVPWNGNIFYFIRLKEGESWQEDLENCRRRQPRFFCINDDLSDTSPLEPIQRILQDFFQCLFPKPCSFERQSVC